ncbi:hypothetical protein [Alicyclobacillus sp. SO9]|uniref:hypothetical protein n=1 Tax=Alicyclobacillus sp. SO9 TaxID=2665646 RepID=UPI0018E8FEB0|nr:hypothetical protein [Alicyclobacillus sp. SO9]QQE77048.1 hypothetical protein GI364_13790 [Alicyclobacillus sp. SO9]
MSSSVFLFWFMLGLIDFVTLFGVGTALNMLTKLWWIAPLLYLAFSIYLIAAVGGQMTTPEWILFFLGWLGVGLSSWAVRALKKRGYPLFS